MFCSWAINHHSCLCTWKYPKRQSTVRRSDIPLSFTSHFHSGFEKNFRSRALLSLSLIISSITRLYLLSFSRRTTMWIIMNTGGAFNDRSIHTMNACGCLFFYYYLAVRNNRANYHVFLFATRCRVLSRYEKSISSLCIDFDEAAREIIRDPFPGQIPDWQWEYFTRLFCGRFSPLRPRSERKKSHPFSQDFKNL